MKDNFPICAILLIFIAVLMYAAYDVGFKKGYYKAIMDSQFIENVEDSLKKLDPSSL